MRNLMFKFYCSIMFYIVLIPVCVAKKVPSYCRSVDTIPGEPVDAYMIKLFILKKGSCIAALKNRMLPFLSI